MVFEDGRFGCAAFPKNKAHLRRILKLDPTLGQSKEPHFVKGIPIGVKSKVSPEHGEPIKVYSYQDEQGKETFQVCRYEPKAFRQRQISEKGNFIWNLDGVRLVPFNLPRVLVAETVFITEGEKDAEALNGLGFTATCNSGGAGKWRSEWSPFFANKSIVIFQDNDAPGEKHAEQVEKILSTVARSIRLLKVPAPAKDISEHLANLSDSQAKAAIETLLAAPSAFDALLDARRFDLLNPPPQPTPTLSIDGKPIATNGNLLALTAQAKAGKTGFITAMLAAVMNPAGDCLGIQGRNVEGFGVIHFDTEQSPFDHHQLNLQVLRRAARSEPPQWFRSYRLADLSTTERRNALDHEMQRAAKDGTLCAVFLDGVADLCHDPNDPIEAFQLVEDLHRRAILYACPIICVLHENPGSDRGKTRGHLGSQLERKAETNLRLSKNSEEVTTVFTDRSRHCHISKADGLRFKWDEIVGMHVSCEIGKVKRAQAQHQKMQAIVENVFGSVSAIRYTALTESIMDTQQVKRRRAQEIVGELLEGFVQKDESGLYRKVVR